MPRTLGEFPHSTPHGVSLSSFKDISSLVPDTCCLAYQLAGCSLAPWRGSSLCLAASGKQPTTTGTTGEGCVLSRSCFEVLGAAARAHRDPAPSGREFQVPAKGVCLPPAHVTELKLDWHHRWGLRAEDVLFCSLGGRIGTLPQVGVNSRYQHRKGLTACREGEGCTSCTCNRAQLRLAPQEKAAWLKHDVLRS